MRPSRIGSSRKARTGSSGHRGLSAEFKLVAIPLFFLAIWLVVAIIDFVSKERDSNLERRWSSVSALRDGVTVELDMRALSAAPAANLLFQVRIENNRGMPLSQVQIHKCSLTSLRGQREKPCTRGGDLRPTCGPIWPTEVPSGGRLILSEELERSTASTRFDVACELSYLAGGELVSDLLRLNSRHHAVDDGNSIFKSLVGSGATVWPIAVLLLPLLYKEVEEVRGNQRLARAEKQEIVKLLVANFHKLAQSTYLPLANYCDTAVASLRRIDDGSVDDVEWKQACERGVFSLLLCARALYLLQEEYGAFYFRSAVAENSASHFLDLFNLRLLRHLGATNDKSRRLCVVALRDKIVLKESFVDFEIKVAGEKGLGEGWQQLVSIAAASWAKTSPLAEFQFLVIMSALLTHETSLAIAPWYQEGPEEPRRLRDAIQTFLSAHELRVPSGGLKEDAAAAAVTQISPGNEDAEDKTLTEKKTEDEVAQKVVVALQAYLKSRLAADAL